ncbi:hypothetical protein, partial [Clostridium sp.]|uniref:hypothetical protein n=1 Tax=Clostridium sp. TaxID=1506 RepID=UPI0035A09CA2
MITNNDLKFLKVCKQISKCSDFKQTKMGACITYGKKYILAVGFNANKTSPIQKKFNQYRHFKNIDGAIPKVHAEISAISKLPYYIYENNFNMKKSCIYIYREHKGTHRLAMAFPCPACMAAIKQVGIKRIVYSIEDGIKEMRID